MTDPTPPAFINTFIGQFELRNCKQPRRIETPSRAIAWELNGPLVSCQTAVHTLAVGPAV